VNVADTDSVAVSVILHVVVAEHPAPAQPANVDPKAGVADNVTVAPCETLVLHVPGQLIPPPLTAPLPEPVSETVSVS
jgi:hypothetical protein